jgi:flagellar motility protein MotE (MotC chaperone)
MTLEDQAVLLKEVEDRSKGNTRRIETLEKKVDNLADVVSVLQAMQKDLEHLTSDVRETKEDVKELKEKPGKRWEGVVEKVIYAVVGAVVAFLLAKGGL